MIAYVVKQIAEDRGPMTSIMKNVKKQPYSYICVTEKAGGTLWDGHFEYKNSMTYGVASDGSHFDLPVLIRDTAFVDWYKSEAFGMAEVPNHFLPVLENIFSIHPMVQLHSKSNKAFKDHQRPGWLGGHPQAFSGALSFNEILCLRVLAKIPSYGYETLIYYLTSCLKQSGCTREHLLRYYFKRQACQWSAAAF